MRCGRPRAKRYDCRPDHPTPADPVLAPLLSACPSPGSRSPRACGPIAARADAVPCDRSLAAVAPLALLRLPSIRAAPLLPIPPWSPPPIRSATRQGGPLSHRHSAACSRSSLCGSIQTGNRDRPCLIIPLWVPHQGRASPFGPHSLSPVALARMRCPGATLLRTPTARVPLFRPAVRASAPRLRLSSYGITAPA